MDPAHLSEFERQYSVQSAEVTARIGRLHSLPPSERTSYFQSIQKLLLDVTDLLDQMQLAVRDLPAGSALRSKYELRVKSYFSDKKQLDTELEKALGRLREEGEGGEAFEECISSEQQEDLLIENTERLERTSRKLQDAYRMAIETEQIGSEVLGNLSSQRDTLQRAQTRMREASHDLSRSSKVLSQMMRRIIQNKVLLFLTGFFLVFSLVFIIYKSL